MVLCTCMGVFIAQELFALEADEVLVVVNGDMRESVSLGMYYMKKRSIPSSNLLKVSMSKTETCTRQEYDLCLAIPFREHLLDNGLLNTVKCIVLLYGVPLKISDEISSSGDSHISDLKDRIRTLEKDRVFSRDAQHRRVLDREIERIKRSINDSRTYHDRSASVDSELALVQCVPYTVEGWVDNPMYIRGGIDEPLGSGGSGETVLMVSRLDAPEAVIVRRMIDESFQAEKVGLKGRAYFDARWPKPDTAVKPYAAYRFYDQSIHLAAQRVLRKISMPVVVDHEAGLFEKEDCPKAALYCGWYSLGNYVDAFEWVPGAVGYHIASGECVSLKDPKSRAWCPMMLKDGITATLGPVSEPYIQAFPLPEVFFSLLTCGSYTLVECYFLSQPYLSWKMVLIGDPLYRPFATH